MFRFSFQQLAVLAFGLFFFSSNAMAQGSARTHYFGYSASNASNPCKVFIGVGTSSTHEGLKVDYTIDDTPAQNSGILAGDIILAIDGVPVSSQA
jgi:S1-C subfamily serine protease